MAHKKKITILGVTGSIGQSAADVILSTPERFDVQIVTAGTNAEMLAAQALKLNAKEAVIGDETKLDVLRSKLEGTGIKVSAGTQAVEDAAAAPADFILAGIVGIAGLKPIMKAIGQGTCVGIANKEPLVAAGPLVMAAAKKHGTTLLPIDSEHNAVFQVFDFERPEGIEKITLTASGGPFLRWSREEMARATPEQAVAHPNWSMGAKISVDSATMMNKGLELIEASHIFPIDHENIEILVHPQSVIHSMVEYVDGSVLAQLGTPDMRIPIASTFAWPDRTPTPSARLDFAAVRQLTFEAPDLDRFPSLRLAREAVRRGGVYPAALNAANEIAVASFLAGALKFLDIAAVSEHVLGEIGRRNGPAKLSSLEEAIEADGEARRLAERAIAARAAA